MIKVYIRASDFNDLFDRFKSDEDLMEQVYFNLFKSDHVSIVVLREPNDSLANAAGFIKKLKTNTRLIEKNYDDDMDYYDMFNHRTRGIVFHHGSNDKMNFETCRSAMIYANVESNKDVIDRIAPLFTEYSINTATSKGIGKVSGFPLHTIVYQDNYFLKTRTSKDITVASIEVIDNIDKIFGEFIRRNRGNIYNNTLYLDFIYGKFVDFGSAEKFQSFLDLIKNSVRNKYKEYELDVICSFTKGKINPHARIMVSDYFAAQAGEEFYKTTHISANGILLQPGTYKELFDKLKKEMEHTCQMKIIEPGNR